MKKQHNKVQKAMKFYLFFLQCYPNEFKELFASQMLQSFQDHYQDVSENGNVGISFWAEVIADEIQSIAKEQIAYGRKEAYFMNKYIFGIVLGLVLSTFAVLTNIVFPNNAPDDGRLTGLAYLILFFLFGIGGYFASKKTKSIKSGAIAGAVIALIGFDMTMLTFIVIDNIFLSIVSQQADKIWAFTHQHAYHNMQDFINSGNVSGFLFGTVMVTIMGAFFGMIGAVIRRMKTQKKFLRQISK